MPELPQIEPDTKLQVPETVGIQRLNLERPNPALETAEQGGRNLESQLSELGQGLQRQKISTDILNAHSAFINGTTALTQQTEGMSDPDARYKALDAGSQGIVSGFLKTHSDVAPIISQQLNLYHQEFMRQAQIETHNQKDAIGLAQSNVALHSLIQAAASPNNTQQDEDILKQQGRDYINQTAANGFMKWEDVPGAIYKMEHDVQASKLNGMLTTPNGVTQALSISFKDSGLDDPKEYLSWHSEAVKQANQNFAANDSASKLNTAKYTDLFNSGKTNEVQDFWMYQSHYISDAQYATKWHHPPTNQTGVNDVIAQLNRFTKLDDTESYLATIAGRSDLTSTNKADINAYASRTILPRLRATDADDKADSKLYLKSWTAANYPDLLAPTIAGKTPADVIQRKNVYGSIVRDAGSAINAARNADDRQGAVEKFQDNVKKLVGIPSGAKSTLPGTMLPTGIEPGVR